MNEHQINRETGSEKTYTCIVCPKGCSLKVKLNNNEIAGITGFQCSRGEAYARAEALHPTRTLTTIMGVTGGLYPTVAVKSSPEIPRELLFACMEKIRDVSVKAPVKPGDILISNIGSTGSNIVATGHNPLKIIEKV